MIIAFSGAHGTGKTTSVLGVHSVVSTPLTPPRDDVLTICGISRQCPHPLNKDATAETQAWIYARLLSYLAQDKEPRISLTDRTMVDWIAYVDQLPTMAMDEFYFAKMALKNFPLKYDRVYVTYPFTEKVEADGVRDTDPDYRQRIADDILNLWGEYHNLAAKLIFDTSLRWFMEARYKMPPGTEYVPQEEFVSHCVDYVKKVLPRL